MNGIFEKNRPVIAAGILYTITALVVVISAWIEGLHRFELDLTISIYIGLRHWTAYLYMGIAVIMVSLVIVYLKRSNMHIVRKCIYGGAFLCILGCAFFPHNGEWSVFASNLHNYFAYILMFLVSISIVMMMVKGANKSQRVFGIVAAAYAVYFIIAYMIFVWKWFVNTIFLWENTFIYILIGELMVEYEESRLVEIFSKRFPFVGLAGGALTWIIYFIAPRGGRDLSSMGQGYINTIYVAEIVMMISLIVFSLSFIMYMLYRPLAEKKLLDVVIRVILTPVVIAAMLLGAFLTLFIISGAGY